MDSAYLKEMPPAKTNIFQVYLVPGLDRYLDDGLPGLECFSGFWPIWKGSNPARSLGDLPNHGAN